MSRPLCTRGIAHPARWRGGASARRACNALHGARAVVPRRFFRVSLRKGFGLRGREVAAAGAAGRAQNIAQTDVVKAAAVVEMHSGGHHINGLRVIAQGDAISGVIAVPHAALEKRAVHGSPADAQAVPRCVHHSVGAIVAHVLRRHGEVVPQGGLIVDAGDHARRARAKGVLRRRVRNAARAHDGYVHLGAVRGARDLVQRSAKAGEKRARGGVSSYAGCPRGTKYVAWASRAER